MLVAARSSWPNPVFVKRFIPRTTLEHIRLSKQREFNTQFNFF